MAEYKKTPIMSYVILAIALLILLAFAIFQPRAGSAEAAPLELVPVSELQHSSSGPRILINGREMGDYTPARTGVLAYQSPKTWQLSHLDGIAQEGFSTMLVFQDGSRIAVSPSLYKQLPGEIQVRVNYEGPH
jgi:hypothetical protein